jgi:hypothetical protein
MRQGHVHFGTDSLLAYKWLQVVSIFSVLLVKMYYHFISKCCVCLRNSSLKSCVDVVRSKWLKIRLQLT